MSYLGRGVDKISNIETLDNITFNGASSYTLQKGGVNFVPSSASAILISIQESLFLVIPQWFFQ
mgnify:CR=1 FL=1